MGTSELVPHPDVMVSAFRQGNQPLNQDIGNDSDGV